MERAASAFVTWMTREVPAGSPTLSCTSFTIAAWWGWRAGWWASRGLLGRRGASYARARTMVGRTGVISPGSHWGYLGRWLRSLWLSRPLKARGWHFRGSTSACLRLLSAWG